jgi:predicted dehydrogenase
VRAVLLGAGAWAQTFHCPLWAEFSDIEFCGIWSRNVASAERVASEFGVRAFADPDEAIRAGDIVAFAVPPTVQADLAYRAATLGKALVLEKPVALTVEAGERLLAEAERSGSPTLVLLTYRFLPKVRRFLQLAARASPRGGRAAILSNVHVAGPYATEWRLQHGALYDVGPHVVDLVDAALGRVTAVSAAGCPTGWTSLTLEHESGAASDVSICAVTDLPRRRVDLEILVGSEFLELDEDACDRDETLFKRVRDEVRAILRGDESELGLRRGVHLVRILDAAFRSLRTKERCLVSAYATAAGSSS